MKIISLPMAGVAFIVICAIILTTVVKPSSMAPPLEVIDVVALADGGTIFIKLRDHAGKVIGIQRVGEVNVAREQQQLKKIVYLVRWIPIPILVEKNSEEWLGIRSLLDGLVASSLSADQLALLRKSGNQGIPVGISAHALAAFELAEWMHISESKDIGRTP